MERGEQIVNPKLIDLSIRNKTLPPISTNTPLIQNESLQNFPIKKC